MNKFFRHIILSVCCLLALNIQAQQFYSQQIAQAEYFWGTADPGNGNGTPLAAQDGAFSDAVEAVIASGVPANGLNLLNVRLRNYNGAWGPIFKAVVNADALFTADLKVTQAEYFIDADPGTGAATALLALDGNFNSAIEAAFKTGFTAPSLGLHTIGVRVLGIDGVWGPVFKSIINVDANFTADLKISAGEYFIDSDPGQGAATALVAFDGNYSDAVETAVKSSLAAPSLGLHTLNVRFKGSNAVWGPVFKAVVNIDANFTADLKVNSGEYFIDSDPGQGAATALFAFDGNYSDAIETALKGGVTAPSLGLHTINARFKGSNTYWGPVFKLVVNVDANFTSDLKVTAAEYYFDTDPGEGSATAMLAADGNFSEAIELAVSSAATAALVPGNHILAVRMKGFYGVWGPVFKLVVVVDGCTPLPSASISAAGSTTICPGDSVVLNANTGTGLTYQWRQNGANIQGATTASYSAKQSGSYDVAITNTSGCGAISSAITVTLAGNSAAQVTIVANSSTTLCAGTAVSFTATAVSGGTAPVYQWRINNTPVGTNSPTFSTTALSSNDVVSCIMTSNAVCVFPLKDTSNIIGVNVYSAPTATVTPNGPTTFCQGGSVGLSALPGYSYFWSNSLTSQSITVTAAGTYTVTVTDGNNCTAVSAPLTVSVGSSATASISPATVTVCSGTSTTLTASGGGTYTWSNNLGSNASVTVSPTGTTTYTVTVSNGNCSTTASRTVTVNVLPNAAINGAAFVCSGQQATLTASGGNSYAWANGLGSNAQINVSPTGNTTYTVTVTDGNGCTNVASQTINVTGSATASISPATVTICNGASATLTASGGTYAWSNGLGSNASVSVSPTGTTTYTVTVANGNCSATVSRTVNVNALPNAAINGPASVCSGLPATLNASGGNSYAWANGLGSNAQINVSPTGNTTYTVTVTDGSGCTKVASQTINVTGSATASISPATAAICNGGSIALTATGGGTYAWSNSGNTALINVSPAQSTTYTVTVTNGNCTTTASRLVTVNALPNAAINGPASVCSGLPATLTASGGNSYAWANGLGTSAQINVAPTTNTTYTVTVTNGNGCTKVATQTINVTSSATASISGSTRICTGQSATLTANGGNTYAWANGLGSNAQVSVSPASTTTYTVTVSVGANCTATASHTVSVGQPSASQFSRSICSGQSFFFNGANRTQGGTYKDTLSNSAGCDSIITLTLTVSPALTGSTTATICQGGSYAFNGRLLTQPGSYKDTLQSTGGCDSILTLTLSVSSAVTGSTAATICQGGSYTFNGQLLTQTGIYKDTLQSTGGCDSILTLTLNTGSNLQTSIADTICSGQFYLFGGTTISQPGIYTDTVLSVNGCDSVITLALTVNSLPMPVVFRAGDTLTTQTYSNYQWLLNSAAISGATSQVFKVPAFGSYSVQVTDANGCSNTSNAVGIFGVGISEVAGNFGVNLYPNPNQGLFTLAFTDDVPREVEITNALGQVVVQKHAMAGHKQFDLLQHADGVYFVHIRHGQYANTLKFTLVK